MITKRQFYIINFFLIKSSFIGFGFSLIYGKVSNDAWISGTIGLIIGIFVVKFLNKLNQNKRLSLNEYNKITSIFFLILISFIFHNTIVSVLTLVSSFFLIKTPVWFILIPILGLCFYATMKGIKTVARVAEIIFNIRFLMFIIEAIGFLFLFKFNNLLPILDISITSFADATFCFVAFLTTPLLISYNLEVQDINKKDYLKSFLIPAIANVIIILVIAAVFGEPLINMLRFPEYAILKKIDIFKSVNNIENILLINYIFDLAITDFVCCCFAKDFFKKVFKTEKKSYIATMIWLLIIGGIMIFGFMYRYKNVLSLYAINPYILFIIFTTIIILIFIRNRKKKTKELEN